MAIRLLAFDFDGVILESLEPKREAMALEGEVFARRFAAELGPDKAREAVERLLLYHHIHGGVSRVEKFAWLYREYLGREILPEELAAHCRAFTVHSLDRVCNAPLVPGALEVLEAWHTRLPVVVCSGTPQAELVQVVERRGPSSKVMAISLRVASVLSPISSGASTASGPPASAVTAAL